MHTESKNIIAPSSCSLQSSLQIPEFGSHAVVQQSNKARFFEGMYDEERNQTSRLKNEVIRLQKVLRESEEQLSTILQSFKRNVKGAGMDVLVGLVEEQISNFRTQTKDNAERINSLQGQIEQFKSQLVKKDNLYQQQLNMEMDRQLQRQNDLKLRLSKQLEEFEDMKASIYKQMQERDSELRKLNHALNSKENILEEKRLQFQQMRKRQSEEEQKYQEEMEATRKLHENKVKSIQTMHQKFIAKMTRDNDLVLQRLNSDRTAAIKSLKEAYEAQLETVNTEAQDRQRNIALLTTNLKIVTVRLAQRDSELESATRQNLQKTSTISELQGQAEQTKQLLAQTESSKRQVELSLREEKERGQGLMQNLTQAKQEIDILSYECNKRQLNIQRLQLQMQDYSTQKQAEFRTLKQYSQEQISSLSREVGLLQLETKNLTSQLLQDREHYEAALVESRERLEEQTAKAEHEINLLKKLGEQNLQEALQSFYKQKESIVSGYETRIYRNEEQARALLQNSLKERDEAHELVVTSMEQTFGAKLTALEDHVAELSKEFLQKEEQLKQLEQAHLKEKEELEQTCRMQLAQAVEMQRQIQIQLSEQQKRILVLSHRQEISQLMSKLGAGEQRFAQQILRIEQLMRQKVASAEMEGSLALLKLGRQKQAQIQQLLDKIRLIEHSAEEANKQLIIKIREQCAEHIHTLQERQRSIVQQMTQTAERRMVSAKSQHQLEVAGLQRKHTEHNRRMQQSYEERTKALQLQHEVKVGLLEQSHKLAMQSEQARHSEQLRQFVQQMDSRIEQINRYLEVEKVQHSNTKLTTQQRIALLLKKVQTLKTCITGKESENESLHNQLQGQAKAHQTQLQEAESRRQAEVSQLQSLLKAERAKLSEMAQSFNNRLKQLQFSFEERVKAERQKIQQEFRDEIARLMKQLAFEKREFDRARQQFEQELAALRLKYAGLQKTFQERPPRNQDLLEIKRLNDQIQTFNAKMELAQVKIKSINEVVYYLHLQLQNYKEAYAIFGPHRPEGVDLDKPKGEASQHKKVQMKQKIAKIIAEKVELECESPTHLNQKESTAARAIRFYDKRAASLRASVQRQRMKTDIPPLIINSPNYNMSFIDSNGSEIAENAQKIINSIEKGTSRKPVKQIVTRRKETSLFRKPQLKKLELNKKPNQYFSHLVQKFQNYRISLKQDRSRRYQVK